MSFLSTDPVRVTLPALADGERLWVVVAGRRLQIVAAADERAAAEQATCSVHDLMCGLDVHVQPYAPSAAFFRAYDDTRPDPRDERLPRGVAVTLERPAPSLEGGSDAGS